MVKVSIKYPFLDSNISLKYIYIYNTHNGPRSTTNACNSSRAGVTLNKQTVTNLV